MRFIRKIGRKKGLSGRVCQCCKNLLPEKYTTYIYKYLLCKKCLERRLSE